jgi:hypothetical protein
VTDQEDELDFGRIGASDPGYNLRRDPVLILRKSPAKEILFVSVLEAHGTYNPVTEIASDAYSEIKSLRVLMQSKEYTAVRLVPVSGAARIFMFCHTLNDSRAKHKLSIEGKTFEWQGPVYYGTF